jgi:polyhydroxyalkanoate synthesis regulator phasin
MFDLMRKAMLVGIGALTLSEERARAVVEELMEQGKVSKEEGQALVKEMREKAETSRKEWEAKMRDAVQDGLRRIDVVVRSDYEALEKKVEELSARIKALEEKNPG